MKQLRPMLNKVLEAYGNIDKLSDDQLREKCTELKKRIQDAIAADESRIAGIKEELETDIPLNRKEELATESDKLVKKVDQTIEDVLEEILPEAFAIMKSTARRFKENPVIRVKATQFDRDLSATKDFVSIDGDYALWNNHWVAGGNEITWDMVHYDVQLIGGIVLHQGKIAEMATGEGKTLVATLPVFLNALAGKGVHVVTVNDYLSKRDSEWMGPLYMFHGLSVDCIDKHEPNSEARKKHMHATLPSEPTTSSASTTCATIWPYQWMTSFSASIISRLSMRWTQSLLMTRVPLSSYPDLCRRGRISSSLSSSLWWSVFIPARRPLSHLF